MARPNQTHSFSFALGVFQSVLVGISLVAIAGSFVVANSTLDFVTKSKGFSAIIVGFLILSFVMHYWNSRKVAGSEAADKLRMADAKVEEKLFAIEEAGEYFGGSVKPADVFRLIANKINDIVPFTAITLNIVDRSAGSLRSVQAQGEYAESLRNREMSLEIGVAGRCFSTEMVQIERGMISSDALVSGGAANFRSSAAIPLIRSGEVYAVLQLFSESKTAFDACRISVLEAVGERVAPLVFSSLSFERSVSNALTDPVTDLPNERAFHLILENHIAETQRNPASRPLIVLALDLRNFDEINNDYGHASGDRILGLVAQAVKGQLRQMDFISRAENDEFLVIMPTANRAVADDVIGRIKNGLAATRFFVNDKESINPELNFGVSEFGNDGESAEPLILAARLRKQQAKTDAPSQVLWFPRDLAN